MKIVVMSVGRADWAPERSVAELQPRWVPPPSMFLDVAGMKVHVRDGSSLHACALKGERRVVRFDLPGFGLTGPSPDRVYSTDNDIEVLIAVLDKLAIERSVLGRGASLGGAIAGRAALAHPDRVEKLILVDAGGYPRKPISQPLGFRLASIPGMDWLFENLLPRYLVEQGFRGVWGDAEHARDLRVTWGTPRRRRSR